MKRARDQWETLVTLRDDWKQGGPKPAVRPSRIKCSACKDSHTFICPLCEHDDGLCRECHHEKAHSEK